MRKNKTLPFAIALIGLAVLIFFRIPMPFVFHIDEEIDPFFLEFPMQIGRWTGELTEVDQKTYEILETRNILSRTYKDPSGNAIHLLLVSSNKDRRVAHPPEVCYLGSNYIIVNEKESKFDFPNSSVPVKEFIAKSETRPDAVQHVLYVYKIGDRYTTNYYSQQLKFALDHISHAESKIFLIRLSAANADYFEGFLQQLTALLP